ncbi:hypothetical protein BUALT_Bualt14G0129600 [Buddleja alternifolia]|uniref:Uncharacterized protein n=1 Tax=Buddleja alternifolia TaxID=168488 RepID=A0AAV6WJ08_9LAMI|nr:hypothetical protein BUALT_Bualt14G0129600 [Buddleja alternifolia]
MLGKGGKLRGHGSPLYYTDQLEFLLNLEYLEAEFFSWGAFGCGLDSLEPKLAMGDPPPIGVMKANLNPLALKTDNYLKDDDFSIHVSLENMGKKCDNFVKYHSAGYDGEKIEARGRKMIDRLHSLLFQGRTNFANQDSIIPEPFVPEDAPTVDLALIIP